MERRAYILILLSLFLGLLVEFTAYLMMVDALILYDLVVPFVAYTVSIAFWFALLAYLVGEDRAVSDLQGGD